jgi:peptide/nickel transport system permease protein
MTEPASRGGPPADAWERFFAELGRRRLFKLAAALLALLYASAIYAPLIASDRPYYLEGIDRGAFAAAQRELVGVTRSLAILAAETEESYLARRAQGSTWDWAQALKAEAEAALRRGRILRDALPRGRRGALDDYLEGIEGLLAAGRGRRIDEAVRAGERAVELAEAARRSAEEGRAELVARSSWPLFASLSGVEVFLMVLWAFVLGWPLWNPLVNRRLLGGGRSRIRRRRRTKLAVALSTSLAAALAWAAAVPSAPALDAAPYKARLGSGAFEVRRALFPPLALGFSETHMAEGFRPPTWTRTSGMDVEGYYLHGPRRRGSDAPDGFAPPPTPVEVRWGEPALNSPWRHPLGTDALGRDLLVRLLWGGRVSLSIGLASAALLTAIGVVLGSLAGYFGGWTDLVISRLIEVVLCIPALYLVLMASALVDPAVLSPLVAIVLIIALVAWTGVARLARAEFLRLRESELVLAARALGLGAPRIIVRHVLPNALGPILVAAAFAVAAGILTESVVSFLGFGIQHPVPSWGSLVNESRSAEHWWVQLFPGLAIFVTVTCYNLVGEAIRDSLDPRSRVSA